MLGITFFFIKKKKYFFFCFNLLIIKFAEFFNLFFKSEEKIFFNKNYEKYGIFLKNKKLKQKWLRIKI